nr:SGNH/GDSL hydrolase family protein [uncultured Acetatifactor sp.]
MKISEIDRNLAAQSKLDIKGLQYRNALEEPFDIYGLYRPKETGQYRRLPMEVAERVNEGVAGLCSHTAGGRIRFRTDSPYVAVKAKLTGHCFMPHMPLTGSHGLDLYVYDGVSDVFQGTFVPPVDSPEDYESVLYTAEAKMREITIHLPLYSGVAELYIGLDENAKAEHGRKYRPGKPVLYYGSSITQGGCASRPGNHYPTAIARENNTDFLCLGFSGSARGEPEMAEYLAGLPASVFVCDYDHNAPDREHLEHTHAALFQRYRQTNPDTPVIFVSKPDIRLWNDMDVRRRDVVYQTYIEALRGGDRKVYFVDGFQLFSGNRRYDCTVDGCHPNDLGFARMAEVIGEMVRHCLAL